jgi:protein-export membrane protein SecD
MSRNSIVWLLSALLALGSIYAVYPNALKGDFSQPNLNLGLDLQGGTYLKLEVEVDKIPLDDKGHPSVPGPEAVARAVEVIRNRVDQLGLKEPLIQSEGDKYIVVQLPGDKDPARTEILIGQTAQLHFKLISERVAASEYVDSQGKPRGKLPEGVEILKSKEERGSSYLAVEKKILMAGDAIQTARVEFNQSQFGQPLIAFELTNEGADKFARLTEENVNRRLAIVLDGVVQSAPVIKSRIGGGRGVIEGTFTKEEAKDLALVLRSGALPAPMKVINRYVVGPTLGADTIRAGTHAALIGTLAVLLYMIFYYRVSGAIADLALVFNLIYLMGGLAFAHATLTLPGIAGIVLTMGMSVDANVIIFERIREELKAGKTVRTAIDAGYSHAFWTIFDSHVTSLITALILFQFGTGPIKGFAVSLSLGVAISLFTALFISKAVFDARKQYSSLSI